MKITIGVPTRNKTEIDELMEAKVYKIVRTVDARANFLVQLLVLKLGMYASTELQAD
jgi:hypothetical protein